MRAQRAALVARHDALRRILDDPQIVPPGDRNDGIHLAGHAGIVHRHDRPRARRDRGLDQPFVQIERVFADIDKDRNRAAQHEGVCRRHECVGRQNDFVAAFDVQQQRGQIQRGGAGVRQQRLGAAGLLLDPLMAALRERSVAGKMMVALRLGRIDQLLARRVRPVERNIICCHCFAFTGLQRASSPGRAYCQIGGFRRRNQRPIPTPPATKPILRRVNYRHPSAGLVARCDAREVSALNEEPVDARGDAVAPPSASEPSRARRLFAGWSANLLPDDFGNYPAGRAGSGFSAFLDQRRAGGVARRLRRRQSRFDRRRGLQFRAINRFLAFKSSVDCDGRTARFYAAMLRIYLGLAGLLVDRWCWSVAQLAVALHCARISGRFEFRRGLRRDDGRHAADAAVRSGDGSVSRARALWPRGAAAEPRPCSPASSVNWSRSSRPEACWPSPSPMWQRNCSSRSIFWRSMLPACFRSCASGARTAFVALDCRPVSQGGSVCGGRRHGTGVAQSAGTAGQRFRVRSRGRRAMGPYPRRRGPAAVALRSDHASAGRRTWPRLCRRLEGPVAQPLCPRIGVRDGAGERRGLRAVAILAGFFRALDPWRHSLRSVAHGHVADRHQRRSRRRSWRSAMPITAIAEICWCGPKDFSSLFS